MIGWLRAPRDPRHRLAVLGGKAAMRHLRRQGLRILARNWQSAAGEIDIIAERQGTVHFVEVKTRASDTHGSPEEAVDAEKQRRIRNAARAYLRQFPRPPEETSFDIVAIEADARGKIARIRWNRAAF